MASEKVLHLTDSDFESTIKNSATPVLVDFWAEWCGPCRRIAPIIDELAAEYEGRLAVGKVNIDEHQDAATQFGVSSIPTLILFKDGQPAERIVGALPKEELEDVIKRVI
jgi:thioredoxin 1